MSKRSLITCNTEGQKIRWRIKVAMKKLRYSWGNFRDKGGKERDHTYHWARMLRKIETIEANLQLLTDKKRVQEVRKRLNRIKKKMEPYRKEFSNITKEFGNKKPLPKSKDYRRTVRKVIKEL